MAGAPVSMRSTPSTEGGCGRCRDDVSRCIERGVTLISGRRLRRFILGRGPAIQYAATACGAANVVTMRRPARSTLEMLRSSFST